MTNVLYLFLVIILALALALALASPGPLKLSLSTLALATHGRPIVHIPLDSIGNHQKRCSKHFIFHWVRRHTTDKH